MEIPEHCRLILDFMKNGIHEGQGPDSVRQTQTLLAGQDYMEVFPSSLDALTLDDGDCFALDVNSEDLALAPDHLGRGKGKVPRTRADIDDYVALHDAEPLKSPLRGHKEPPKGIVQLRQLIRIEPMRHLELPRPRACASTPVASSSGCAPRETHGRP